MVLRKKPCRKTGSEISMNWSHRQEEAAKGRSGQNFKNTEAS